ncbi:hypothetical protein [Sinomonas cyclohexanicum]|uniref:hypothetical protein n=1 Tax=Sinomonas cyclohexanicum TaxID=322009 RepID=UPI001E512ED1|nr:hypothetical protein [Corynebacterium cyclohexanicum]
MQVTKASGTTQERDQLETRALPRFTELRHHVYEQIQLAKQGHRPDAARPDKA